MWQGEVGRERRVYERVVVRCPVKFRTEGDKTLAEGSSRDLSDAGLGLFTHSRLEPQMHLELWIKLSPQIQPLHIAGRVVWSEQRRPDLWRAGICFDEMAFVKMVKILLSVSRNLNEKGKEG